MDPSPSDPATVDAAAPSASTLPPPSPPPMIRSYVLSTAAGSCFVALLAVAFTVVWRRKQRWRRTRPWLAKLRAETASKIEKEREKERVTAVDHKEPGHPTPKDTAKGKEKEKEKDKVVTPAAPEARTDGGKRSKERRKRGKEPKAAARNAAPAPVGRDAQAPSTLKPVPPTLVEQPIFAPPAPPSPHLIPLPPSPTLSSSPTKLVPPALILSGPVSPVSTTVSLCATATELTATTPTTSISFSPVPTSPAPMNNSETTLGRASKLPAFPPASPLPPSLARKPPPLARRPTPATGAAASTSTPIPNISRKDSHAADRRKEPSRKGTLNDESDGPVEEIEFPTLSPWPVVGKQQQPAEGGKRRDMGGRKSSDVGRDGRKASDAGRGRKPSDARKKAGVTNPESTQLASLRGALEAARIREEEVAEERRSWAKKERELQTQINQLAHQLQLAMMFPGGGMQGYPGYGYGYGPMPPTPGGPGPIAPVPPAPQSQAQSPAEAVSPEQTSPVSTPAPVPAPVPSDPTSVPGTPAQPYPPMYLPFPSPFPMFAPPQPHGSPMPIHGSPMPSPMPAHAQPPMPMPGPSQLMMSPPYGPMSPPQSHPFPWRVGTPTSGMVPMPMPVPSRRPTGFFGGSPRGGSRSRSPYVHPPQRRHGTPSSTPSVGSSADIGAGSDIMGMEIAGLGNSADIAGISTDIPGLDAGDPFEIVHTLPTSLKRDREQDDDDDESSSEESDYDEDSDDDSVIFEDGSVSDSVNLSLHGENKEQVPDLISLPVDIRIGDDTSSAFDK